MQLSNKLRSTTLVALLLLQHQVQALNTNLTVTFSLDSRSNCATTNDTSQGVTFSTDSIALTYQCFNLDDVFTSGNTTRNLTTSYPHMIFSWTVSGKSNFNPAANFSRVWYQQTNDGNVDSGWGVGGYGAKQALNVYSGRDCNQVGDSPKEHTPVKPIYRWTCATDVLGDCAKVPYKVQSFAITTGPSKKERCLIPALSSAGVLSGIGQRGVGIIGAGAATLVAAMLML